jgi:hypothetical protein
MPKGRNPKDAAPHHTPDFYIDDSRLDVGIKAFSNIVFDYQATQASAKGKGQRAKEASPQRRVELRLPLALNSLLLAR